MTNENITLTQMIDRLSAKEKPINLKYIECLQHRVESFWHDSISYSIETYYPLLESINLDMMYGMIRYRCDRLLYREFRSRREKNGSYYVKTEDRLALAKRLFSDCLDEEEMTIIANSEFMSPYDCRTSGMKSNIISNEMIDCLSHKIKIDDENHILYYKDGEEFKEIRNYSDADFADFLVEPIFSAVDPANVRSALKRFKRFIANRMSAKG